MIPGYYAKRSPPGCGRAGTPRAAVNAGTIAHTVGLFCPCSRSLLTLVWSECRHYWGNVADNPPWVWREQVLFVVVVVVVVYFLLL